MTDQESAARAGENVPLYADDTLEDLQRGGFRMLQKKQGFRFGLDSVLLAAYAASFYAKTLSRQLQIADLGSGCGAVSLLLAARLPGAHLTGLEIDRFSHETMKRNIRLNHLEDRLSAVEGDIRQLAAGLLISPELKPGSCDLVVSNPPYEKYQPAGQLPTLPEDVSRRRARQETDLEIDSLTAAAARLLRPGGRLVLVHQVRRLPDIIISLRIHGLEAKTMRLIETLPGKQPVTFLLSAIRQGRPGGFIAEPPLLVCTSPGAWSKETAALYGLEPPLDDDSRRCGLIITNLEETR